MSGITEFTQRIVRVAFYQGPIIEYFPFLAHVPSYLWPWKREAQIWSKAYSSMYGDLFQDVKDRLNCGDQRSSFVASIISKQERLDLSDKQLSWLTASIASGSETVAASMGWFLFAMIQHPEIQKKAQLQLDAVVGRSRLPSFEDMKDLPYIHALVRETLRWHPVDPLGTSF
ncbi:hypothetical protein C0991_002394 [Blastosporella zonata]|nr:hypothetical protein C0991_002394 [Blastosporella zonata]